MALQTRGLGLVLELPLGDAASALKTVAMAIATPYIAYRLYPSRFKALAEEITFDEPELTFDQPAPAVVFSAVNYAAFPELRSIWSTFHPVNLLKVFAKNCGLQFLVRLNTYMLEVLEHEKQGIEAEELGEPAPELPPLPDISPVLREGTYSCIREVLVTTVRRIFEHAAVWRLGGRAVVLLRDSRAWIKEVLAVKHRSARASTKLASYASAVAHSSALFYAADCTVAIGFLTYRTVKRRDKTSTQKVVYWIKGSGLQVVRCTILLVTVAGGAALGSLAQPGLGTSIGQLLTDLLVSYACVTAISSIMD